MNDNRTMKESTKWSGLKRTYTDFQAPYCSDSRDDLAGFPDDFCPSRRRVKQLATPLPTLNYSYRMTRAAGQDLNDLKLQSSHLNKRFVKSFLQNEKLTKHVDSARLAQLENEMDRYYRSINRYQ